MSFSRTLQRASNAESFPRPPATTSRRAFEPRLKTALSVSTTLLLALGLLSVPTLASAASPAAVNLKSASTYSVVTASYLTLATSSTVSGDAAAFAAITKGNPQAVGGATHENNDAAAKQAITDMNAAYADAAGRTNATQISGTLDGLTLTAGVYHAVAAFGLAASGTLTLDGGGDPNAVFILQTEGALVTGGAAQVQLTGRAQASNVFWQTPSYIVFGAGTKFAGTLLPASYVTFGAGSQLSGRALAANYVGMASATITTSSAPVAAKPGAPTAVTAIAGTAQAVVSWKAPTNTGGSPITRYTITSSGGQIATTTGATSATVTGLTNGTAYRFTVTATNATGRSLASVPSKSVTPIVRPGIPSAVTAMEGNGRALVSWTAPTSNGGSPISRYTVTSSAGQIVTAVGKTSAIVSGLTNGVAYTFTVTATNATATSLASARSNPVTPTVVPRAPTGVTATVGNGQASVSWKAPANFAVSPVTRYTVTSSGGQTATAIGATTAVVKGLVNGVVYTFTVTASNATATSLASAPSNPVTPKVPSRR